MILADENIDSDIVSFLRTYDIEVTHVAEEYKGVSDREVIDLSKNPPRVILTEDKDFGEWVYAHKEDEISVIFLRYAVNEKEIIMSLLLDLLKNRGEYLFGKFTTITSQKIRIRSLK